MRQLLVCVAQPERFADVRLASEDRYQLETELLENRSIDLLVVDEDGLRSLGARAREMRTRGSLRAVLVLAPANRAGDVLQGTLAGVVDDFVAPSAPHEELAVRIRLCMARGARLGERALGADLEEGIRRLGFQALAEDTVDVVARYGRDLRYQYVNTAITQLTGIAPESLIGKRHIDVGFEPKHAEFWDETLRKGFRTGESARVQYTFPTPHGLRYLESRLAPERGPDGSINAVVVISRDMTDRVLVESALRISEARLAEALALAETGSWDYDPETNTSTWSQEMYRLLEQAPAAKRPDVDSFLAYVHPDNRAAVRELASLGHVDPTHTLEYRLMLPGGKVRHLSMRARASVDPLTQRTRIVGATTDVTERKFRELERESERSLLELLARDASLEECLEYMVDTLQALFPGILCSVSVSQGNSFLKLAAGLREYPHARDKLSASAIGADASPCGRAAQLKQQILALDLLESPTWQEQRALAHELDVASWISLPILSSQQQVLGTFAMYLREARAPTPDESRCLARAASLAGLAIERDRYHRAVADNEALLRTVFDNSPIGIYLCDPRGRVVYMNRAVGQALGMERPQLMGKRWLRYLHRDDKQAVTRTLRELLEGRMRCVDLVWRQHTPLGETKDLQVHASAIQGADGHKGFVGTIEDITARLKFEEQLRHGQKMEAVGQLAGGVAHDFNNLLTVILNGVSLLDRERSAKDRNLVRQIELAAERASTLTKQLLAFGRRQRMSPQVVDLEELIANLSAMLRRLIGEQNVLQTQIETQGGAPAQVDPNLIEQMLLNLVVNARDAMPRGGKILIKLSDVASDHASLAEHGAKQLPYLCLRVTDTGIGIAQKDLSRVFEPFYTTKEPGKGTGLGLATVYAIVEQHGGFIEVDSRVGGGTSVKVFLPRAPRAAKRTVVPASSKSLRGNETILLAEDEPAVREMVRTSLESCGYRVLEASNGDEALAIWQQCAPQIALLITDMVMPGKVLGGELAQRLRADRPGLRVVYMSGYGGQALWLDTYSRFVAKPFQVSTLGELVRECLDARPDNEIESPAAREPLPAAEALEQASKRP